MEIQHLAGATSFFPGKVNVGCFEREGEVWFVDSGLDDEAGRRLARWVESEGIILAPLFPGLKRFTTRRPSSRTRHGWIRVASN